MLNFCKIHDDFEWMKNPPLPTSQRGVYIEKCMSCQCRTYVTIIRIIHKYEVYFYSCTIYLQNNISSKNVKKTKPEMLYSLLKQETKQLSSISRDDSCQFIESKFLTLELFRHTFCANIYCLNYTKIDDDSHAFVAKEKLLQSCLS